MLVIERRLVERDQIGLDRGALPLVGTGDDQQVGGAGGQSCGTAHRSGEVAVQRAMSRDGVDADTVQQRVSAQLSNDERRARAHVVIDNSADEAAMNAQLDNQWRRISGENAA